MPAANVGIAGTGFMAWVHAEALRREGHRVMGIVGSNPAKGEQAAVQLGIDRSYPDFRAMLADSDIDSVHVCTPNQTHFSMVQAAVAAGKHVLCEKPLAMDSGESRQLVTLAEQHPNVVCGVNYNIRFYPLCAEVRSRIAAGELGRIYHVTGSYVQDWLLWEHDYNWRVDAKAGGNLRAVADIGTHWLDLIQSITCEKVIAVCADLHTVHENRKRPLGEVETFSGGSADAATESIAVTTEDFGAILLQFESGGRGSLHVSQVSAGRKNCLRFEIAGANCSYAWDSEHCNELWIGHRDRPNETLTRDPALLANDVRSLAVYPGGHNEGYADTFRQCFRAFYQTASARRGEPLAEETKAQVEQDAGPIGFPTFADGHREILLCEAILQSHRRREWIAITGG